MTHLCHWKQQEMTHELHIRDLATISTPFNEMWGKKALKKKMNPTYLTLKALPNPISKTFSKDLCFSSVYLPVHHSYASRNVQLLLLSRQVWGGRTGKAVDPSPSSLGLLGKEQQVSGTGLEDAWETAGPATGDPGSLWWRWGWEQTDCYLPS